MHATDVDEPLDPELLKPLQGPPPPTLAEALGLTEELGEAILAIAVAELEAGRVEAARTILEGLVAANPRDPDGWILLARVQRALRQPLAARFCAEVAARLAPEAPAALLARAEGLLPFESERPAALGLLRTLSESDGDEAERARALITAIGG